MKFKGNGKIRAVSFWIEPSSTSRMGVWTAFCSTHQKQSPIPSLLSIAGLGWRRRSLRSVPRQKMAAFIYSFSNLKILKSPQFFWSGSSFGMYCLYPWEDKEPFLFFIFLLIYIQCTSILALAFFFAHNDKWGCQ